MDEYKWNSDDYQNAPEVTSENKTAENTECFSTLVTTPKKKKSKKKSRKYRKKKRILRLSLS